MSTKQKRAARRRQPPKEAEKAASVPLDDVTANGLLLDAASLLRIGVSAFDQRRPDMLDLAPLVVSAREKLNSLLEAASGPVEGRLFDAWDVLAVVERLLLGIEDPNDLFLTGPESTRTISPIRGALKVAGELLEPTTL